MEVHDQIVARRFVLVDEEGNPAAYITGAEVGFIGLHIEGPGEEEEPLVSIGLEATGGSPVIQIRRPEGGKVLISVAEDGRAGIQLVDADGAERIVDTT